MSGYTNVINRFRRGEKKGVGGGYVNGVGRLRIEGNFLVNYDTPIAFNLDGRVVKNDRFYSQTTSGIQSELWSWREVHGTQALLDKYIEMGGNEEEARKFSHIARAENQSIPFFFRFIFDVQKLFTRQT